MRNRKASLPSVKKGRFSGIEGLLGGEIHHRRVGLDLAEVGIERRGEGQVGSETVAEVGAQGGPAGRAGLRDCRLPRARRSGPAPSRA